MSDSINPDHYKFPGGAEVIGISEHLSANGAQAVQYIARATRQDGKIKGDPLEDLRKAEWFIKREINRLTAVSDAGPKFDVHADGWKPRAEGGVITSVGAVDPPYLVN
jgi:hypothetical protein